MRKHVILNSLFAEHWLLRVRVPSFPLALKQTMDPSHHHPLPILTYMAQAHAPDGMPPPPLPPPPMLGMTMPGVSPSSASDAAVSVSVSDADLDKHMIAKGLARLPEPHTDADLDLLWRTLATEVMCSFFILLFLRLYLGLGLGLPSNEHRTFINNDHDDRGGGDVELEH